LRPVLVEAWYTMSGEAKEESGQVVAGTSDISDGFGVEETWGSCDQGTADKVWPCQVCFADVPRDAIERNLACAGCALFVVEAGLK